MNFYKKEVNIDNKFLESFFSDSNKLFFEEDEELKFDDVKKVDEIYYIIKHMLPEIERQIIYFLYFLKRNQEAVGRILKISQEMVCYYKKRALARIKFYYFFRNIDIENMEKFLKLHVTKKQLIAMVEYFKEHDLRKIVKKISKMENRKKEIHYEAIGSRIKLGIKRLEALKNSDDSTIREKADLYFQVFNILKKYNSLHHTQGKKKINTEIAV